MHRATAPLSPEAAPPKSSPGPHVGSAEAATMAAHRLWLRPPRNLPIFPVDAVGGRAWPSARLARTRAARGALLSPGCGARVHWLNSLPPAGRPASGGAHLPALSPHSHWPFTSDPSPFPPPFSPEGNGVGGWEAEPAPGVSDRPGKGARETRQANQNETWRRDPPSPSSQPITSLGPGRGRLTRVRAAANGRAAARPISAAGPGR